MKFLFEVSPVHHCSFLSKKLLQALETQPSPIQQGPAQ